MSTIGAEPTVSTLRWSPSAPAGTPSWASSPMWTSLTSEDGRSVPVLSSYPAWRGLALHSLAVAVCFVCTVCEHTRDSTMVATHEHHSGFVCPSCYAHAQHSPTPAEAS